MVYTVSFSGRRRALSADHNMMTTTTEENSLFTRVWKSESEKRCERTRSIKSAGFCFCSLGGRPPGRPRGPPGCSRGTTCSEEIFYKFIQMWRFCTGTKNQQKTIQDKGSSSPYLFPDTTYQRLQTVFDLNGLRCSPPLMGLASWESESNTHQSSCREDLIVSQTLKKICAFNL